MHSSKSCKRPADNLDVSWVGATMQMSFLGLENWRVNSNP